MGSKKILVIAYQISPFRGSEYSVAWNYVTEMSKDHELVVLFGAAGNHMGDLDNFDKYIDSAKLANVRFVQIKPNIFARTINILNKKGWFIYAFYFAYRIWHWQVYQTAVQLINKEYFDLIHFLNPHGFREPGYLWKIDLPYIWGPIGGMSNRPIQLIKALPFKERVYFIIRNWINTIQFKYNWRLKKAIPRTDLLLTATTQNQNLVQNYYKKPSIYLPENGIINSTIQIPLRQIDLNSDNVINIIWIGRIDANKSLNILLKTLANVNNTNWHLHVIGDGPRKISMQKLSKQLKIENGITWHGLIQRAAVFNLLKISHLHIITSLGEGNPTTIWETMSYGIPTVTLDHCGMHDTICDKCGVRIKIISYDQVIKDLAFVLSDLLNNNYKINLLSKGVNECVRNFTWEKRKDLFNSFYIKAIENWEMRKDKK